MKPRHGLLIITLLIVPPASAEQPKRDPKPQSEPPAKKGYKLRKVNSPSDGRPRWIQNTEEVLENFSAGGSGPADGNLKYHKSSPHAIEYPLIPKRQKEFKRKPALSDAPTKFE